MKKAIILFTLLALPFPTTIAFAARMSQSSEGEVYVVQANDWLSKIAQKYYGDLFAYPTIVAATNARAETDESFAVIDNPDLIEIGQKLWIPAQGSEAGMASSGSASRHLTLDQLRNVVYQGIYDEPVQLADGIYEGEPFVEGGASRPTVTFVDTFTAFGDLNGDGADDAAVILAENSGGSGVFIYLAAVVDQDGTAVNVATTFLGDRIEIEKLVIEDGQITVDLLTQGPDDPFCCPTLAMTKVYQLQGNQLGEQANFAGTYQAILPAASSPGRDITLNLNADNTVTLSTDYLNGQAPIVEIGTWQDNQDGTATVTLTGRPDGTVYETPVVITFQFINGELTAIEYDPNLYGSEGLRLVKH